MGRTIVTFFPCLFFTVVMPIPSADRRLSDFIILMRRFLGLPNPFSSAVLAIRDRCPMTIDTCSRASSLLDGSPTCSISFAAASSGSKSLSVSPKISKKIRSIAPRGIPGLISTYPSPSGRMMIAPAGVLTSLHAASTSLVPSAASSSSSDEPRSGFTIGVSASTISSAVLESCSIAAATLYGVFSFLAK